MLQNWCRWCQDTFSGPLSIVLACMLPELHAVKVLFYAESVGVATSGHVTKMAAKPFDPPLLYANCTALSFIEPELLPIEVLHCGNREFRIFLRKITENIIFPIHVAKLMQIMPKHIFWPIIDCSSLYATGVTRGQGAVLRKIGGRGHFRSRSEKMAVKPFDPPLPKTPVYANCTALSFIEPELLPIDFFTAQVGIWRIFSNNSGKY